MKPKILRLTQQSIFAEKRIKFNFNRQETVTKPIVATGNGSVFVYLLSENLKSFILVRINHETALVLAVLGINWYYFVVQIVVSKHQN